MTNLPYASDAFNAVICLWSAFNELLEEDEQRRAIAEMWRVLDGGGFALIEGRPYEEPTAADVDSGARRGPEHRIEWGFVEGLLNPHYRHDERSLQRICETVGVQSYGYPSANGAAANGSSCASTRPASERASSVLSHGRRFEDRPGMVRCPSGRVRHR